MKNLYKNRSRLLRKFLRNKKMRRKIKLLLLPKLRLLKKKRKKTNLWKSQRKMMMNRMMIRKKVRIMSTKLILIKNKRTRNLQRIIIKKINRKMQSLNLLVLLRKRLLIK